MEEQAVTTIDLQGALPLVSRGKVRDLYHVDDSTLLFIATDRISAYDVVLENVSLGSLIAIDCLCLYLLYRLRECQAKEHS